MKVELNSSVLFNLTSKKEEALMDALHEYLDNMFFAN